MPISISQLRLAVYFNSYPCVYCAHLSHGAEMSQGQFCFSGKINTVAKRKVQTGFPFTDNFAYGTYIRSDDRYAADKAIHGNMSKILIATIRESDQ